MKFRTPPSWAFLPCHRLQRLPAAASILRTPGSRRSFFQTRSSVGGGSTGGGKGESILFPGATLATLVMLAALHARRLYSDKQVLSCSDDMVVYVSIRVQIENMKEKGIELEFSPDVKAAFLKLMPLRSISRIWGALTSVEIPVSFRPLVYKAWARAFHSNLDETAVPLENYASLQDFFVRSLKEGSRPIDSDPHCLISPVDGTILRCGELKNKGTMIEQVKGFSYSVSSLLGANTLISKKIETHSNEESKESVEAKDLDNKSKSLRLMSSPPNLPHPSSKSSQRKRAFYCVIYLRPGDYHRIHSPVDWNVYTRRHFTGRLYPVNERATRTIRNLHVENERVVLEGLWKGGFIAMALVGATNIGSIALSLEPDLKTNRPKRLLRSVQPDERVYEPEGMGFSMKKGDELAAFKMGSTVVLVFEALLSGSQDGCCSPDSGFCIKAGDRVRVGEKLFVDGNVPYL